MVCVVPKSAAQGAFSTSFPATENPISQGGLWTNGKTTGVDWQDIQTTPGESFATAHPTPGHFDDCVACLSGRSFNANHYAQATVFLAGGYSAGHEVELFVRMSITPHSVTGYEFYMSTDTQLELVRWNGALDDFTVLTGATHTPADGDVMRLEVVGNSITAYVNGSPVMNWTDNTFATGKPGMGNNPWDAASVFASFGFKNYQAGNL